MRFLLVVAWRNLWRHRRRTLITATAMAVGVALSMSMLAYMDGFYAKLFDVTVTQNLGHVQIHDPDYPVRRVQSETIRNADALLSEIDALSFVAGVSPRLFGFGLVGGKETTTGARLVGVVPDRELTVVPMRDRVVAGRWLAGTPVKEAVIGTGLADTLSVGLRDEIVVVTQASDGSIGNDVYRVVGLARTGSAQMDRAGVWLDEHDLQELLVMPDQVHEIVLLAKDAEESDALAAAARTLPHARDLQVRTWKEADPDTARMMGMQNAAAAILLAIVFAVAALGVLNTMLMAVFERTRELGVLRALGLAPKKLVQMVLLESLMLGFLAGGGGLILGGLLDLLLVHFGVNLGGDEPLEYQGVRFEAVIYGVVRPEGIVLTVVMLVLMCVLASLWPAVRASRLRPVDAMRQV